MSVNKVILVGNVGKDPEVKKLQDSKVCTLNLATSETYKDKQGNKQTTTEWHNVILWNKLAEIAGEWVKKGSQVYIEGKIKTRSWDDKDGNKRYTTEVFADTLKLLGGKPEPKKDAPVDPLAEFENNEPDF